MEFWPALRTVDPFETLTGHTRDGKTDKAGVPKNPLRLALILREYEDEVLPSPTSVGLSEGHFRGAASIGRILGIEPNTPTPTLGKAKPSDGDVTVPGTVGLSW